MLEDDLKSFRYVDKSSTMRGTQDWGEEGNSQLEAMELSALVLPLLETVRAFGFLIGQAILIAQPLLSGIVSEAKIEQVAALLDDPERLGQMRKQLEK